MSEHRHVDRVGIAGLHQFVALRGGLGVATSELVAEALTDDHGKPSISLMT